MLGSRPVFTAVALGVAFVVAGCGGTDFSRRSVAPAPNVAGRTPSPRARNPVLQAAVLRSVSATSAARTARTSISVTPTGLGDDSLATGAYDIAGTGVVDFVSGNADLSLSIPLLDRLGGGGTVEERTVGGVLYTKMPAGILRAAALPPSVRWLSLDPRQAGGADPSALSPSQVDPAGQLAFVAAASDETQIVGHESVRGEPSTHYATTIDLRQDAGGDRRTATLRARLAQLGSAIGDRQLALDVWLDRVGRVRRVVVSVPLSPQAAAGGLDGIGPDAMIRIQGDFYAFGTPVRVTAPPPSQTRPYSTLRSGVSTG
jgi:hypothetical protein